MWGAGVCVWKVGGRWAGERMWEGETDNFTYFISLFLNVGSWASVSKANFHFYALYNRLLKVYLIWFDTFSCPLQASLQLNPAGMQNKANKQKTTKINKQQKYVTHIPWATIINKSRRRKLWVGNWNLFRLLYWPSTSSQVWAWKRTRWD